MMAMFPHRHHPPERRNAIFTADGSIDFCSAGSIQVNKILPVLLRDPRGSRPRCAVMARRCRWAGTGGGPLYPGHRRWWGTVPRRRHHRDRATAHPGHWQASDDPRRNFGWARCCGSDLVGYGLHGAMTRTRTAAGTATLRRRLGGASKATSSNSPTSQTCPTSPACIAGVQRIVEWTQQMFL